MRRSITLLALLCIALLAAGCGKESPAPTTVPETTAVAVISEEPVDKLDPTAFAGDYMDSTSQRAGMTISFDEASETYTIFVHWANSAFEEMTWLLHVIDDGSVMLSYTDCVCETVTYTEAGDASTETHYENCSGFFTYQDGNLLWDGAPDENCTACVFEKMP